MRKLNVTDGQTDRGVAIPPVSGPTARREINEKIQRHNNLYYIITMLIHTGVTIILIDIRPTFPGENHTHVHTLYALLPPVTDTHNQACPLVARSELSTMCATCLTFNPYNQQV